MAIIPVNIESIPDVGTVFTWVGMQCPVNQEPDVGEPAEIGPFGERTIHQMGSHSNNTRMWLDFGNDLLNMDLGKSLPCINDSVYMIGPGFRIGGGTSGPFWPLTRYIRPRITQGVELAIPVTVILFCGIR